MPGIISQAARRSFEDHKLLSGGIAREMFLASPPHSLVEHGVSAYVGGNFLSRWLFWERLRWADTYIRSLKPVGGLALDFGSGIGLMLPILASGFSSVYAIEPASEHVVDFMNRWTKTTGEQLTNVHLFDNLDSAKLTEGSLDFVLALDVLEHIEDLEPVLIHLRQLLRPNGILLVSGPTENLLYRLGRFIVAFSGKYGFTGDYHVRNIVDIFGQLQNLFESSVLRRLVFPFDLFWIIECRRK